MPTNPSLQTERFALVADIAAANAIGKRLNELAYEPSTKRYTRSRAAICEAWNDLAILANRAATRYTDATVATRQPPKRKAKAAPAPVVVEPPVNMAQ